MARKPTGNPRGRPPYATPLTPAEERVLAFIREGKHNAEIAVRLGISSDTVKYHVKNMLGKLGLSSRDELARWTAPREGTGGLARMAGWPIWLKLGFGAAAVGVAGFAGSVPFLSEDAGPLPATFDRGEVITVGYDGSPANGGSGAPSISADGRFVAFSSMASNLVRNDRNNVADIFVYDRQKKTMQRVSMDVSGREANEGSHSPAISADGRFVAFVSAADNLVAGDTNWPGTAAMDALIAVDRAARGPLHDQLDAVAEKGFRIGFASDVFVYDRERGAMEMVSVSTSGIQANLLSISPSISDDGKVVAFTSLATNLVDGEELPAPVRNSEPVLGDGFFRGSHVYVRDRGAGTTVRLTSPGEAASSMASMSGNGRYVGYVVFQERSDLAGVIDHYLRTSGPQLPYTAVHLRLDRFTGETYSVGEDSTVGFSRSAVSDAGELSIVMDNGYESSLVRVSASDGGLNALARGSYGEGMRVASPAGTRNGRFLAYVMMVEAAISVRVYDGVLDEEVSIDYGVGGEVPSGLGEGSLAISENGRIVAFPVRLPADVEGSRLAIYVAER